MEEKEFLHNLCDACEQYAKDLIAKRRNAGASVSDLMQYYDPDVRFSTINLQDFAEQFLDERTRNEWEGRCEQEQGKEYGTRFNAQSLISVIIFNALEDLAREYYDGESLNIVTNDSYLWEHLDIKKKEKRDRFNLLYEVASYIYDLNLIESLEVFDHYRECIWKAIYGWCEEHDELIRDKYALKANDYPLTPLF